METPQILWAQRVPGCEDLSEYQKHSYHPSLLKLIAQRGLCLPHQLESFLNPKLKDFSDPFLIPDMDLGVKRILQAIDQQEKICIYGDYDVDGITSIAAMCRILEAYGAQPRYFIPKRSVEGYGLSTAAIQRCMREGEKPDLLITVDCGSVSHAEIDWLNEAGIDVVVIDHHEPIIGKRPNCVALVNPKSSNAFTYLCAAGVVFKVGHALLKSRPISFDLKEIIDLVAIATISDIVPMVDENRILVRYGLEKLPKTVNLGLKALQQIVGMPARHLSTSDVGFKIGPRLNAAGRMDMPEDALATILTKNQAQAQTLAKRLDQYNRQRQNIELVIRDEAEHMLQSQFNPIDDAVIVLASRQWHHGIVGIVASRMMRQYHKPTFIISIDDEGIGKGSGRSVEGVSLVEAIAYCRDHLMSGGGHAMAAGLTIHEEHIEAFRDAFKLYVQTQTQASTIKPTLYYDAEIQLKDISFDFLNQYELLQPFGNGNPEPHFICKNVITSKPPTTMKDQHLKMVLKQQGVEYDAIYFHAASLKIPKQPWDVAFTISRNVYRGTTSIQLTIESIRQAQPL